MADRTWNLTRRRLLSGASGTAAGFGLSGTTDADSTTGIGDILEESESERALSAGAGEASMAWRVGAKPGQVGTGPGTGLNRSPYPYSTIAEPGAGIHSEPTAKAIVLESGGQRYALVKADTFLMHEQLHRRVADLVSEFGIERERLIVSSTHNHSAPHATSSSLAVAAFTDVFDIRHWSYQTRQMAAAIERAVESLEPATLSAVEGTFDAVQENIIGPSTATEKATTDGGPLDVGNTDDYERLEDEDGNPIRAGFPEEHTEDQFVVLRFDTPDGEPIAATLTMGMHPESLNPNHGLTTGEFVGIVERRLEAHVDGAFTAAFLNGALGDVEPSRGNVGRPDWWRESFGRMEEMADEVAREAIRLFERAGETPRSERASATRTVGTHSRPNKIQNGEEMVLAYGRDVGVAASSLRLAPPPGRPGPTSSYLSQEAGSGLEVPSTGAAQESASPYLVAIRLGDILLATYPGEAISDVSFNLRSRVLEGFDAVYQGYHWPDNPEWVRERIADNFSETTVDDGYEIAALLSVANAWQGYFVTRWEYENRNHYRESLTPYGPDSADHVNSALVDLAAELRGGEPARSRISPVETADSGRRELIYRALVGAESSVRGYRAAIPPAGEEVGTVRGQPAGIERFETATVSWVGGSNAVDLPRVVVQRRVGGEWIDVADSEGHKVVLFSDHPPLREETQELAAREREWQAAWEAPYDADPGTYRFFIQGIARGTPESADPTFFDPTGANTEYELRSEPFALAADGTIPLSETYTTLEVADGRVSGRIAFEAPFRAVERPADGTVVDLVIDGDSAVETTAVYDTDGFYLDAAIPDGDAVLIVEEGAYVDGVGNPTARVERQI